MPLQGTFDVLDFAGTLRLLARQRLSGKLHVRTRTFASNLFFEDGALVGADYSDHHPAAFAGDVRSRLEEICFEMLEAVRGTFEFQPGQPPHSGSAGHDVETVLARARQRLDDWHGLQKVIPSLQAQPHLVVALDRAEITINQERWRLLTLVDGRRNLRTIGRILGVSDFDVSRVTKGLLDEGIVELNGRPGGPVGSGTDTVQPRPQSTRRTAQIDSGAPNGEHGLPAPAATAPASGTHVVLISPRSTRNKLDPDVTATAPSETTDSICPADFDCDAKVKMDPTSP